MSGNFMFYDFNQKSVIPLAPYLLPALCLLASLSQANTLNSMTENLRLSLDVSSRTVSYEQSDLQKDQQGKQVGYTHVIGMDLHKVFSDNQGDVGTLVLQTYLTKLDNQVQRPGFFEDENDSKLVYRIMTFNYTRHSQWRPNIKLGHLELPYGLEHSLNTNGTLKGYQQGPNLGIKADWGMSLNKQHQNLEYEVSATTGGNQEIKRQDGSYVYSARIGTPRSGNQVIGASIYESSLANNKRRRFALDAQYYWGLFAVYGQFDTGEDNQQDVHKAIIDLNWRDTQEITTVYLQSFYLMKEVQSENQKKHTYTLGVQLDYRQQWDISAQYQWDQQVFTGESKNPLLSAQLRYRF